MIESIGVPVWACLRAPHFDMDESHNKEWSAAPVRQPGGPDVRRRIVLSHTTEFLNWCPDGDARLKIHFTPGQRFSYSGEGYVYLTKVVECLTGEGPKASSIVPPGTLTGILSSSFNPNASASFESKIVVCKLVSKLNQSVFGSFT